MSDSLIPANMREQGLWFLTNWRGRSMTKYVHSAVTLEAAPRHAVAAAVARAASADEECLPFGGFLDVGVRAPHAIRRVKLLSGTDGSFLDVLPTSVQSRPPLSIDHLQVAVPFALVPWAGLSDVPGTRVPVTCTFESRVAQAHFGF